MIYLVIGLLSIPSLFTALPIQAAPFFERNWDEDAWESTAAWPQSLPDYEVGHIVDNPDQAMVILGHGNGVFAPLLQAEVGDVGYLWLYDYGLFEFELVGSEIMTERQAINYIFASSPYDLAFMFCGEGDQRIVIFATLTQEF
jgi:hypothetical protein